MKTTLPILKYIPILGRFPRPKVLTSLLTILALVGAADGIDTKAQQGTGNQPQSTQDVSASLFSFSCSLDYPPPAHGSGVAEYVPRLAGQARVSTISRALARILVPPPCKWPNGPCDDAAMRQR